MVWLSIEGEKEFPSTEPNCKDWEIFWDFLFVYFWLQAFNKVSVKPHAKRTETSEEISGTTHNKNYRIFKVSLGKSPNNYRSSNNNEAGERRESDFPELQYYNIQNFWFSIQN